MKKYYDFKIITRISDKILKHLSHKIKDRVVEIEEHEKPINKTLANVNFRKCTTKENLLISLEQDKNAKPGSGRTNSDGKGFFQKLFDCIICKKKSNSKSKFNNEINETQN